MPEGSSLAPVASSAVACSAVASSASLAAPTGAHRSRRITILYLVDQLTELGGGERMLLQIARSLPQERFRVLIATFRGQEDPFVWTLGCDLHILPMARTFSWHGLNTARKLRRLIRASKVDLVHTFFETADIFGSVVARLSGVKAIVSSRRDMGILRSPKHDRVYRLISPLYGRVVAVSDEVRAEMIRRDRLNPTKVITIHNGLDLARFTLPHPGRRIRCELGIPDAVPLVSTIANIQPWKGLDVFVRCAAEVIRTAPGTHFVVAGAPSDSELAADLKALAASLGIGAQLHWIGSVERPEDLLAESTVFCLLSHTEGFPNVILEAMAAGIPVVGTRVGGTPAALEHGVTGWLVDAGDWSGAAQRVLELLADMALRTSMGNAGRARVAACFTQETMMANYIQVYESVLAGSCVASQEQPT